MFRYHFTANPSSFNPLRECLFRRQKTACTALPRP
jgi:hypothetical protein